jgi:hypothetical protein
MAKKKATPNAKVAKPSRKKSPKVASKNAELPDKVDRSMFEEYPTSDTSVRVSDAPEIRFDREKAPKVASNKPALPDKVNRSVVEADPSSSDSVRVRFIPPSADVLFARAKIGAMEILETVAEPGSRQFFDPSSRFLDIGYKFTNGIRTNDISVRLHVHKKRSGVPFALTCFNGRVCTDVLESNFKTATKNSAGEYIESSGNSSEFGTLGMGVLLDHGTTESSRTMFLTCAHVISPDIPTQQSEFEVKDIAGDKIGIAFQFSHLFFENSDEYDVGIFPALKTIPPRARGSFEKLPVQPTSVKDPTKDDVVNRTRVFKVGAKTGSTIGVLDSIGPLFGDIQLENGLTANDHFLVRSNTPFGTFADQGDSGAIVVSEDGRILGMIRAVDVDSFGKRTVVTRMSKICAKFQFNPIR